MALTSEELSSLVLLTEQSQDGSEAAFSLESLAHSFLTNISSDSQFRVLSGLICLLECDLLSLTARYAAFSVLIDSKQAFIRPNILTSLCKNNEESKFVHHILSGNREVLRQSAVSVLERQLPDINHSEQLPADKRDFDERTRLERATISSIIPDPELFSVSAETDEMLRRNSMHMVLCEPNFGKRTMQPEFISVAPPLYKGPDDELEWLFPSGSVSFDVEWDDQMCKNGSGVKEVERLFQLALERKLENEEEQQFKDEIKNEPRMLDMIGLTDEVLPLLVEYNPMITVEILMIILKNKNNETIEKYLRQITNINVTLQSLEVVNRLVTQVELPSDFIPYYITRCRKTCEDLEDRAQQGRLVRLVCVFLRALINNQLFDIKGMLIEVQSFCIEYSRIREAAGLFRLLKSMDQNDNKETASQS